jgi:hypothetical protein
LEISREGKVIFHPQEYVWAKKAFDPMNFFFWGKGLSSEEFQTPCLQGNGVVMTESAFQVTRFHHIM